MSSNETENLPNLAASLGVPGVTEGTVGDPTWAQFINDVVQEINAKRVIVDTVANRPTYEPLDGTLYVATDGEWAAGTGTEWMSLPSPWETGDFTDLTADDAVIGTARISGRPYATTQNRTISVPGDYGTIQAALNDLPLLMRHEWVIDIADGVYNEDVLVPPIHGVHASVDQPEFVPLTIEGNRTDPTLVELNSLFATGCIGGFFRFAGLSLADNNPHENDRAALSVHNCREIVLNDIVFRAGTAERGVLSYSSFVWIASVDLGTDVLLYGLVTKHGGEIREQRGQGWGVTTGSTTEAVYRPEQGDIYFNTNVSSATAPELVSQTSRSGFAFNVENRELHLVENLPNYSPGWQQIATHTESDTVSTFSLDEPTGDYSEVRVRGYLQNHSSSDNVYNIRIDNRWDASSYVASERTRSGIAEVNNDAWTGAWPASRNCPLQFTINIAPGEKSADIANLRTEMTNTNRRWPEWGTLAASMTNINSVQLFTDGAATGELVVEGRE